MDTARMNQRITFFTKTERQNEDGEVIDGVRTDIYKCWAEVSRTSVRDFKTGVGLSSQKDTNFFIIRYHPKPPFDNSMYIELNGLEYKITEIEIDYASKEIIMIKAERVG